MTEKVYGLSEEPWPYEYVINALLYFSLERKSIDNYIVPDFTEILFHGATADWKSGNAFNTTTQIFTECLSAGRVIEEWIEDKKFEGIGLEQKFQNLYQKLLYVEPKSILDNWDNTKDIAIEILSLLNWIEIHEGPMMPCADLLNEYSYGAYGELSGKNN